MNIREKNLHEICPGPSPLHSLRYLRRSWPLHDAIGSKDVVALTLILYLDMVFCTVYEYGTDSTQGFR